MALYHTHRDKNTMLKALQKQYSDSFSDIKLTHNEGMSRFYVAHCKHTNENGMLKVTLDKYDSFFKTHISTVEYKQHRSDQFIEL
ncbi:hypothetical protein [Paraliobacillus ryukyuensis]|uniref:hypothetical protein n=1 Tax=Paraliobacillus ryukyuensis TaxID=200904 RepID=UPI0009A69318|nr:hypothetical protein [Paraliobacillus ryukyuensis]